MLQVLREASRFFLDYDRGDSRVHEVVVEELTWSHFGLNFTVCFDGQNACLPENVGGSGGYAYFLEVIADPTHEEHDSYLEWVGGSFDPAEFDLASANARGQRVRSPTSAPDGELRNERTPWARPSLLHGLHFGHPFCRRSAPDGGCPSNGGGPIRPETSHPSLHSP